MIICRWLAALMGFSGGLSSLVGMLLSWAPQNKIYKLLWNKTLYFVKIAPRVILSLFFFFSPPNKETKSNYVTELK